MKETSLELLNTHTFSLFCSEVLELLNEKWEDASDSYKLKISMLEASKDLIEEKQVLLTQLLLKLEKETGASPEEIVEAITHYQAYFYAHSYFFGGLKETAMSL